jgi:2'-5' RNA ligase
MSLLRTFIAVPVLPTASLRTALGELGQYGRGVRPVAESGLHVTLKFLGDTPAEDVPAIARVLRDVVADVSPFELRLVGLGAFPKPERPSVVWAGVEGAEPLGEMAAALDAGLAPLGFAAEAKAFHPHLTLARVKFKPDRSLTDLFEQYDGHEFGRQLVETVVLYQSDLQHTGPMYTPLATVEL